MINILLVEDNLGDVRLVKESFNILHLKYNLHVVYDGNEALEFLNKTGVYINAPEPRIILLDLNLPKINGYEVLKIIKNDANLKHIPVIILSTSEREVFEAYNQSANSYMQKPVDFDEFLEMMKSFDLFWLRNAKLP